MLKKNLSRDHDGRDDKSLHRYGNRRGDANHSGQNEDTDQTHQNGVHGHLIEAAADTFSPVLTKHPR
jgi:hypothetical protein